MSQQPTVALLTAGAGVILFHKHPTSARTTFLRLTDAAAQGFENLPALSQLADGAVIPQEQQDVLVHPAQVLNKVENQLGLSTGHLELEGEFQAQVDTPDGSINMYLARFTTIDPPQSQMEKLDGKFILITEARTLSDVELELLRQAYSVIMEG